MMNKQTFHLRWVSVAAAGLALVLASCGDDDGDETATVSGTETVNVSETDEFGEILVDSDGNTLYIAEQEADGTISCVDACLDAWLPLTVDGEPTTSDGITAQIGTVERDDGTVQATIDDAPLYTFAFDETAGSVSGHGVSDDFDGVQFTWRVATPSGEPPSPADSDDDDNGDGGGPYGY